MTQDYVLCGIIGAPFKVQGASHFYPTSGQSDHLLSQKVFFLKKEQSWQPLTVSELRVHQQHLVVAFKEIASREEAQKMVHSELYITKASLPVLPQGHYYWYELEGLTVRAQTADSADLGQVDHLYSNGVQDVLVTTQGHQIPFVYGDTIKEVSLASKHIIIDFDAIYLEE